ncbi:MAG: hypothetical protein AB7Q16_18890 [Vicinamibacterales bacterium]
MTNGEFERALAALQSEMRAGFQGINARLDRVNGRLDKTEDGLNELRPVVAEQGVKISTLNREVFDGHRLERQSLVERQPASSSEDGGSDRHRGRVLISLPTDTKTLAALFATAGALIAAALLAWLKAAGPGAGVGPVP